MGCGSYAVHAGALVTTIPTASKNASHAWPALYVGHKRKIVLKFVSGT